MQVAQFSRLFGDHSLENGIYDVSFKTEETFTVSTPSIIQARCDMESDGGGWTVLVRRTPDADERVSFRRTWVEYENGFGNLSTEFWYGLKRMHELMNREPMEVQIEAKKTNGTTKVLTYGEFRVDGQDTQYTLHVSDPKQEGYDPFAHHNERKFSAIDRNNVGCVTGYNDGGGWWLGSCYDLTLTADNAKIYDGSSNYVPHEYAELRVRPKSCHKAKKAATTCSSE